jgi:hypothetical protein
MTSIVNVNSFLLAVLLASSSASAFIAPHAMIDATAVTRISNLPHSSSSSLPRYALDDDTALLSTEDDGDSNSTPLVNSTTTGECVSAELFSDTAATGTASFGDVVRPKYLTDNSNAQPMSPAKTNLVTDVTDTSFSSSKEVDDDEVIAAQMRRRNVVVAVISVAVAVFNYIWQFTHPISPVQLLVGMQETSAPISVIGQNGKPSVVDFWAPVSLFSVCKYTVRSSEIQRICLVLFI